MRLYLGNLSTSTTEAQLDELVKTYGSAGPAAVIKDRVTGESRGFGFVEFAKDDEARAAIAGLDGKDFNGSALSVNEARQKKPVGTAR